MDNLDAFKNLAEECKTITDTSAIAKTEIVADTEKAVESEMAVETETTIETLVGDIVIPVETDENGVPIEIIVTNELGEIIETDNRTDIEVLTDIEKNTSDTLMVLKYFFVIILVLILFRCVYKFIAKWLFGGV